MKGVLRIALLIACAWGHAAWAEDYYWSPSGGSEANKRFSSPASACDAFALAIKNHNGSSVYVKGQVVGTGETSRTCRGVESTGTWLQIGYVYRRGDGCTAPAEYNSITGECVAPEEDKCASTEGQIISHEYNGGPVDRPGPPDAPPSAICEGQCQYTRTNVVKGCSRFLDGDNLTDVFCTVEYKGNGSSCTSGNPSPGNPFDQPPSKPPTKADPTFAKDSKCGDWETQADGTQTRSCNSTEESKQPGKVDCSGDSCKAGVPPPDYSKTDVKQDIEKKPNPDGSTTTKTDTTTDKTSCKGVKPCTSTSKTETTTSEEDAEGKPGDSSYECTGTGCNKEGGSEEEGEEGPEREASVGTCDAGFSCSGDAIDCEILRQQKEQLCLAQEMTDFEKHKPGIEAAVTGDKFELDEGNGVIDIPSFVNKGTRFLPSTCPAAESFSLSVAGGRSFEISYEPLCRAASDLSGLFVAVATVLAALYVGRSVGGQ
ncbi:virulence factor TspB C-terminal domain-related protein [Stutzerimonas nitrititolerans]|uniref:virulence factor TspB C-terminal domain-related protein n=2 Tax=Stutzerimonas nitrititolerans TaxID=2482751 RepID=UPI000A3D8E7B|nr:virulence factor TspB C-terminal domain-related protein [Stutzerimonas nitrititolerans]